jgi:hypothetical protein
MNSHDRYSSVEFRLTQIQREQLKSALRDTRPRISVTARQRAVLIDICSGPERYAHTPEQFLVAFKDALHEAADQANIAHGGDRDDLLARLVSAFIEELFRSPLRSFDAVSESNGSDRVNAAGR